MISLKEAIDKIKKHTFHGQIVNLPLNDALNRVIAEDILSPIDMPPFNQSAMDGYALHLHGTTEYTLIGEVKAGDASQYNLNPGEAIRIFTGGMVPKGANTVAKQEIVDASNKRIQLTEDLATSQNIRPQGEQIRVGDIAITQGTTLNAGAIGYLATLGFTHVNVYKCPTVSVITTGNELIKPGQELPKGKIYESNSAMILAAIKSTGLSARTHSVKDDYDSTVKIISTAMDESDLIILTGGISVGDYDFVGSALDELGVENIFYKVKQKPGKPLYFGKKGDKMIFALPGNPAAALSCFYVYVTTALNRMIGKNDCELPRIQLKLKSAYTKKPNLTHILKAYSDGEQVEILSAQSSAMLSSFVRANCLVLAPEGEKEWQAGETVEVILLP